MEETTSSPLLSRIMQKGFITNGPFREKNTKHYNINKSNTKGEGGIEKSSEKYTWNYRTRRRRRTRSRMGTSKEKTEGGRKTKKVVCRSSK